MPSGNLTKLALGTVQFGMDYGIANLAGRTSIAEAEQILSLAAANGVATLDTAIAYGRSEQVLGQIGVSGFQVVTKLPGVPSDCRDIAGWVSSQIEGSLKRLGVDSLHAVLLHRPEQLLGPQGEALETALMALKSRGHAKKIGLSIYSADELVPLMQCLTPDLIQAPLSILDQRLITSGWLTRLNSEGIEVHTRSAFLQGLLLMPAATRPEKFHPWCAVWHSWDQWLHKVGKTPLEACLGFALSVEGVDKVVIGTDSIAHLQQILSASEARLSSLPVWPATFDLDLLNPGRWSAL